MQKERYLQKHSLKKLTFYTRFLRKLLENVHLWKKKHKMRKKTKDLGNKQSKTGRKPKKVFIIMALQRLRSN